jgi:hypothetical protein
MMPHVEQIASILALSTIRRTASCYCVLNHGDAGESFVAGAAPFQTALSGHRCSMKHVKLAEFSIDSVIVEKALEMILETAGAATLRRPLPRLTSLWDTRAFRNHCDRRARTTQASGSGHVHSDAPITAPCLMANTGNSMRDLDGSRHADCHRERGEPWPHSRGLINTPDRSLSLE